MKRLIRKYKNWKSQYPDKDYQYDEIFDFVDGELSRGEMVSLLEYAELNYKEEK